MQLIQFLFFNALLYISCVLTFKSDIPSTSTATSADPNEERNSEEATGSSSTNLLYTSKNDFLLASNKICTFESLLSITYSRKMAKVSLSKMNKFIVHVTFGESIDKEYYDRENIALIEDIKKLIKQSLQVRNISYAEHKIHSMAYRIFQRATNLYVFYYENLSARAFILLEKKHTRFWLRQISSVLDNANLNIRDYYIKIKERINNDNIITYDWDAKRIHNMTCRIIQFLSDLAFVDSSAYSDLVKI
ncbi:hypothetical protein HEP_00440700 [Hepatocystis sp. ex Piliocolobus tephrosceles]|nr:hypothetical protein HEP_00440700 [Hepatocystis sp. ex Piliocolobus tephrosceles]